MRRAHFDPELSVDPEMPSSKGMCYRQPRTLRAMRPRVAWTFPTWTRMLCSESLARGIGNHNGSTAQVIESTELTAAQVPSTVGVRVRIRYLFRSETTPGVITQGRLRNEASKQEAVSEYGRNRVCGRP